MEPVENILICLPFFTLGGAETQALYLADYLNRQSWCRVTVLAFNRKSGQLITELDKKKINWKLYEFDLSLIHKKGIKKFIEVFKFALFLKKNKFSTILPYTHYPNILCNCAKMYFGNATYFWNQRSAEDLAGVTIIEKLAIFSKPKYIANSHAGALYLEKNHKIELKQVQIIRNGIDADIEFENSGFRKAHSISVDAFVAVHVANLFPEKDVITVLHAWKKLLEDTVISKNDKLVFIGKALTEQPLNEAKALAYDLGLFPSVVFVGSSSNVASILTEVQLGILSSRSEGCPNSVLEYMRAKLPVICTNISAHIEIFGENADNLFEIGDSKYLAQLIIKYKSDRLLSLDNGQKNHERLKDLYSIDTMAHSYQEIIRPKKL